MALSVLVGAVKSFFNQPPQLASHNLNRGVQISGGVMDRERMLTRHVHFNNTALRTTVLRAVVVVEMDIDACHVFRDMPKGLRHATDRVIGQGRGGGNARRVNQNLHGESPFARNRAAVIRGSASGVSHSRLPLNNALQPRDQHSLRGVYREGSRRARRATASVQKWNSYARTMRPTCEQTPRTPRYAQLSRLCIVLYARA